MNVYFTKHLVVAILYLYYYLDGFQLQTCSVAVGHRVSMHFYYILTVLCLMEIKMDK